MSFRLYLMALVAVASVWAASFVHSQENLPGSSWQFLGDILNSSKDPVFTYVDASPHGFSPAIAASSNMVFVAYTEFNSRGTTEIRVKHWDGQNWTKKYTVLNRDGTLSAFDPAIAVLGDVPYVAWTEKNDAGIPLLYATRRTESGWLRTRVHLNVNPAYRAASPVLVAVGDALYLIWTEGADNTSQHLYLRRLAGGHWENARVVLNRDPDQDAYEPSFAHTGEAGYLAWSERGSDKILRIHVRRVNPEDEPLVGNPIEAEGRGHAVNPSIAVFGGTPYLAWIESGSARTPQIAMAVYVKGEWVRDGNIANTNPAANALSPILISGKDALYLAWLETAGDGTPRFHLKKMKDNAWSTAAPMLPLEFPHMASTPALSRDGAGLLAAWKQDNDMGVFKIRVARLVGAP